VAEAQHVTADVVPPPSREAKRPGVNPGLCRWRAPVPGYLGLNRLTRIDKKAVVASNARMGTVTLTELERVRG
jgi:hypothetical protein